MYVNKNRMEKLPHYLFESSTYMQLLGKIAFAEELLSKIGKGELAHIS